MMGTQGNGIDTIQAAGGYGPPGGGGYGGPPPGGGGYGGPPPGGGGGGFGGPPPGGFGPPGGPPPGGGGGGGFGGPPPPGGYGGPPPGGFGPPGGFPPPGGPMMPGAGGDVNTTLPLVLSIVSLFCCGLGTLLGIGGLVLSIQASNAKKSGDIMTAQQKAKTATILAGIGIALGVIGNIIGAVLRS